MIGSAGGQFWPTPEMYRQHDVMYPEYNDANSADEIVRAVQFVMKNGTGADAERALDALTEAERAPAFARSAAAPSCRSPRGGRLRPRRALRTREPLP
jgi:hypothetical protein